MQLVVPIAVKNAVSAATITFTASSMILCFFIVRCVFRWYGGAGDSLYRGWRREITSVSDCLYLDYSRTTVPSCPRTPEIYPLPPALSASGAST